MLIQLIDNKQKLDEFLEQNPKMGGICQYHRDTLPSEAILAALDTHKTVHINETIMPLHPFYRGCKE